MHPTSFFPSLRRRFSICVLLLVLIAIANATISGPPLVVEASGEVKTAAVPAPVLPMPTGTAADLGALRLQAGNATGGTNLYSRNFGWGSSLVGLPGRAGMDAGFGISYNSLVWIKDTTNNEIIFDPDLSNVSPGFKMGFPDIEAVYFDAVKNVYVFLMVNPDGSRTEFRQIGSSTLFESGDSSYRKFEINTGAVLTNKPGTIEITVTSTDGTQMHYLWKSGAQKYQCEEIKDRNGNYIEIDYNTSGRMTTITDTLGREISVGYDTGGYPIEITQTWKGNNGAGSNTTHTWATLSYTNVTVSTSFSGLTVIGPANSSTVKALEKITYADGSFTKFEYNGYVQVKKISNVAADSTSHVLNYVSTNLDSVSGSQTDVPRLTTTRSWVENFNLSGGVPQETVVTNSLTTGASYSLPNSISESGVTRIDVAMTGHPDGLYSRTYVGSSGYKEGLTLATEDCTGTNCATRLRWTWADWTQDNTSASYITNPRVIESRVGDGTNTKKTTIDYGSNGFGLPELVKVYDTDLTTVLKTQTTGYNLSSTYTDRRIIGLPTETKLYEGTTSGTLMSKVTYAYDYDDDFAVSGMGQNNTGATGHDDANYGATFSAGRGNLTSVTRWDATAPTTSGSAVTSTMLYNITGSVVAKSDPLARTVKIGYTDDFNSSPGVTTYAYPTTITDPAGNNSTIEYRYDIGMNVWARSPMPSGSGNSVGKTTSRTYDDTTGRITKEKIENSSAYTRYAYANTGNAVTTYSTVIDVNLDSAVNSSDEVAAETVVDGAGRVIKTRSANPNSTGGYSGKLVEYDILGRVKRETVPTEMNSSWGPAGDDYRSNTFLWNTKEYDWMGRVTRTIPSDSNGSDGKDTLYEYAGCGCAGGLSVTVKSPVATAVDVAGNTQTIKRRWQKSYQDILGRTYKTEIWDLDGYGSAPYSTTKTTFNGRDQATLIRQYSGSDSSSTYQDTTMSYDGHGRLSTRHNPIEDTSAYSAWTYNTDDSVATLTDPRGAVTTYTYGLPSSTEKRALVTGIAYTVPSGSGIADPSDIAFTYDAAGNRTFMSDGTGTLTYTYDELSHLTSETKDFTDSLSSAPSGGTYTLSYTYNLTGGVKSVTAPFSHVVNYSSDSVGRTDSVTGSGLGVTSYVSDIRHRAFGAIKSMTYDTTDETDVSLTYDNALRLTSKVANSSANAGDILNKTYEYFNDGTLKKSDDSVHGDYTQDYVYDFAGRLRSNVIGTQSPGPGLSYMQSVVYDAFNNITNRVTYGPPNMTQRSFTASYTNQRKTSGGYQSGADTFDASGNIVENEYYSSGYHTTTWNFDAAGRMTDWLFTQPYSLATRSEGATITFDGVGRPIKKLDRLIDRNFGNTTWVETPEYSLISSVTGKTVMLLNETGAKKEANVYLGDSLIAKEKGGEFSFKHIDPLTNSEVQTDDAGELPPGNVGRVELEPLGGVLLPEPDLLTPTNNPYGGTVGNPENGCYDKFSETPMPCNIFNILASWNPQPDPKKKKPEPTDAPIPKIGPDVVPNNTASTYASAGRFVSTSGISSFTSNSGEDDKNDPCPWDDDGTKDCAATVISKSDPIEGRFDASNGVDVRPVPLPSNFRDLVKQRIAATQPGQKISCDAFIEKIIAKALQNTNAHLKGIRDRANAAGQGNPPFTPLTVAASSGLQLVNAVSNYTLVPGLKVGGHGAGGTVRGSIAGGDAEVQIGTREYIHPQPRGYDSVPGHQQHYISTAIHELLHLAGNGLFSDGVLAQAAYDLGESKTQVSNPYTNDINEIFSYSSAWDGALAKYCGR